MTYRSFRPVLMLCALLVVCGESAAQMTGPVTVVTELGQVTGVTVTPGEGYLGVSWNAVNGATSYKVQWKSGEALYASDRQQVIDNGSKTSTTITGLTAGTEYTVRVIATLTNADDGQPSVGVTGTPIATTQPPTPPPTSSDDADLSGLTLSAGTLDPAFARDSLLHRDRGEQHRQPDRYADEQSQRC